MPRTEPYFPVSVIDLGDLFFAKDVRKLLRAEHAL